MEGETVVMQDIFKFEETGGGEGELIGDFKPGGMRPNCEQRLRNFGYNLPATMFMGTRSGSTGRRMR